MTTTRNFQGDLLDTLNNVSEYLDNYVDVRDRDDGQPRPNGAMSLQTEVNQVCERLERDIKAREAAKPRTEEEKVQSILRVLRGKMNPAFDVAGPAGVDSGWLRGVARGVLYALEERI